MSVHEGPEKTLEIMCNVEGCRSWSVGVEHTTRLIVALSPGWSTVIAWDRPRVDVCWRHEMPVSSERHA